MSLVVTALLLAAHPLGNFSINQHQAFTLHPDRVEVTAVVDYAELPTLQLPGEPGCADVASDLRVTVSGKRLEWTVASRSFEQPEGAAKLKTSRLTCALTAPAALAEPASVNIENMHFADRLGWREIIVTGDGVVPSGQLPSVSTTDALRQYPNELLNSPLDVRSASFTATPGVFTAPGASTTQDGRSLDEVLLGFLGDASPWLGLLAVLLALLLGAGHAVLPGHGKTVMAVYLAGKQGRKRDALIVGATVTATHTGGVLILGLLLSAGIGLLGERVLGWLGVVSGILVIAVGLSLLRHHHQHEHGHEHHHHNHHSKVIGIASGLVPSPSALIVLLSAIGLGRTGFGVLLVLAYGLGMAATLTVAGLLLLRVKKVFTLPKFLTGRSGLIVVLLGLGIAGRAATILV